jgi:putrescine---pyruvate transaminase
VIHPLTKPKSLRDTGPVMVVGGTGAEVTLGTGRSVIDGTSGLWCVNVGHGRPELAAAAAEQMSRLAFAPSFGGFSNIPMAELAERIASLAPGGLNSVLFTSGGSEANESAFKLARHYWWALGKPDKTIILSHDRAYHGLSQAATAATRLAPYRTGFGPLPDGFARIPAPYMYRCEAGVPCVPEICPVCTGQRLERVIDDLGAERIAALIVEPVIGTGGVIVPPPGYLARLRQICRDRGILFISDEVITGFGRTGTMFGGDGDGVIPDMMTFAKGVTSGYVPLGGVVVSDDVWSAMMEIADDPPLMHGFTYSGHPVACAVALRNLQIIEEEGLLQTVRRSAEVLTQALAALRDLPEVGDVRSRGLMAGVELVADRATRRKYPAEAGRAAAAVVAARRHGLLTRALIGDILMLAPPFVITEEQIDRAVRALRQAIQETSPEGSADDADLPTVVSGAPR